MKKGMHQIPRNKKTLTAFVALVLILCCAVGGTVAWLTTATSPVTNTFTPAHVTTYVEETFNGTQKSNVKVENTGNIDAYIRAAIVFNWVNEAGQVYGQPVQASDYEIDLNIGTGGTQWTKGSDGFYYYNSIVAPGGKTGDLITSLTRVGNPPDGYDLQVIILADGIQAKGIPGAVDAQTAFEKAQG